MYEVAHRFYMEFVPQLCELIEHNRSGPQAAAERQLEAKLNSIVESEMHRWFRGQTSDAKKAARLAAREAFSKRYAR